MSHSLFFSSEWRLPAVLVNEARSTSKRSIQQKLEVLALKTKKPEIVAQEFNIGPSTVRKIRLAEAEIPNAALSNRNLDLAPSWVIHFSITTCAIIINVDRNHFSYVFHILRI